MMEEPAVCAALTCARRASIPPLAGGLSTSMGSFPRVAGLACKSTTSGRMSGGSDMLHSLTRAMVEAGVMICTRAPGSEAVVRVEVKASTMQCAVLASKRRAEGSALGCRTSTLRRRRPERSAVRTQVRICVAATSGVSGTLGRLAVRAMNPGMGPRPLTRRPVVMGGADDM